MKFDFFKIYCRNFTFATQFLIQNPNILLAVGAIKMLNFSLKSENNQIEAFEGDSEFFFQTENYYLLKLSFCGDKLKLIMLNIMKNMHLTVRFIKCIRC